MWSKQIVFVFQVAIDDISVKMQENFQCSERLRLENNEWVFCFYAGHTYTI